MREPYRLALLVCLTTPPSQFLHSCTPRLRSAVVLHCLSGGCQRLGFLSNVCNVAMVSVASAPPLFLFHCQLLWVSLVVIIIIYFVGVYGKGFPVDSSSCIYLYVSFQPLSRMGISYFVWLVCGWSHTRGTWVGGFFPGAGVDKR